MKRIHMAALAGFSLFILLAIHLRSSSSVGSNQFEPAEVKANERMAAIDSQPSTNQAAATPTEALGIRELKTGRDIERVMRDITQITEQTDSNEVYDRFLELQRNLNENESTANIVGEQLAALSSSSAGSRRQLSLLYGSLAQSHSPEALQTLLEAIATNHDEYHMIQAIAAVGDHPSPTAEAAEVLWHQSQNHPESLVRSTALLALGGIANRNDEQADSIQKQLVNLSRSPLDVEQRGILISAMGNHGDAQYWSYLQAQGQDPDEGIRASAIYASRLLPLPEVNDWIHEIAVHDSTLYVKNEALKVLGIRSESFDLCQAVTEIALSLADRDLHFHASNLLISFGSDYAESAKTGIARMQQATPFTEVQTYLAQNPIN